MTQLFAADPDDGAPALCIGFAIAAILAERGVGGAGGGGRRRPKGIPTATHGSSDAAFGLAPMEWGAAGALMRSSQACHTALVGTLAL